MRKICFFSGDITRAGGTERVSCHVANLLQATGEYQVLFLSLVEQNSQPFFPLSKDIPRHALGKKWIMPGPGYCKLIPKLRRFLQEQETDVLIDIDIVLDVLSLPAVKKLSTKVISWEHFNFEFEQSVLYRKLILAYSVKRSHFIVTLTHADQELYTKTYGRTQRIATIHNALSFPTVPLTPLCQREKKIITTANLVPCKGMDYLVEVAAQVLPKHPQWQWWILGEGEERGFLEQAITAHHLEGQLCLAGQVKEVGSYLNNAQVFVLPSRREGLGMGLLEALSFHLPCLSFDISGPREMLRDGENGFLIPPYDTEKMRKKLDLLLSNQSLREELSQRTLEQTESFTPAYILAQWQEIIRQVCQ